VECTKITSRGGKKERSKDTAERRRGEKTKKSSDAGEQWTRCEKARAEIKSDCNRLDGCGVFSKYTFRVFFS
jgi:hypothetical protein